MTRVHVAGRATTGIDPAYIPVAAAVARFAEGLLAALPRERYADVQRRRHDLAWIASGRREAASPRLVRGAWTYDPRPASAPELDHVDLVLAGVTRTPKEPTP